MIVRGLFLLLFLAAAAAGAQRNPAAAPGAIDEDAKCVAVLAGLAGMMERRGAQLNAEERQRLLMLRYAVQFYGGRLGARFPGEAGGAVMLATQRAFPPSAVAEAIAPCLTGYLDAMRAFDEEVQQAAPLANGTSPLDATATAAGGDSQVLCFVVVRQVMNSVARREAELSPAVREALPNLRGAVPFYAGRILGRYPSGARGPAVAAAFRLWPRDRTEAIMGACLADVGAQFQILAAAARQMARP